MGIKAFRRWIGCLQWRPPSPLDQDSPSLPLQCFVSASEFPLPPCLPTEHTFSTILADWVSLCTQHNGLISFYWLHSPQCFLLQVSWYPPPTTHPPPSSEHRNTSSYIIFQQLYVVAIQFPQYEKVLHKLILTSPIQPSQLDNDVKAKTMNDRQNKSIAKIKPAWMLYWWVAWGMYWSYKC